jgi:hypothetical protein
VSRAIALCAALVSLLVLAPAAGAAESSSHPFLAETNGAPQGAARPPSGAFEDACGLALDSNGDRYVADYYHDAVDVFGPSGTYLTQIADESNGNGPCALAVDGAGHLYVENWRAEVVRYTPSAYPPTGTTTYGERTLIDPSGTATGLAVDAATGDLYVDDGTYIAKFEAPVHAEQTPTRIGEGEIGAGYGLARSSFAASAGRLYVPDAASGTVKVFGPAGESLPGIDGAGTPQAGFAHLVDAAVAVDPSDGHVFVADNVEHGLTEHPVVAIDEFNPAGAYRGQISRWITHPASEPGVIVEHALQDAEPPGLAIDPAGKVYVTSGNSDNSESSQLDKDGKPVEGSLLYSFGPTSAARTLTVTKSGIGAGTVTSAPAGIACGDACVAEYDEGSKVTLTATPDSHSNFVGWSGCGSTPTPTTCQVTMSAARSVNAEFAAIPQQPLTVSILGAGEGSVTSEPAGIDCTSAGGACSEGFNEGSTVTLTATPAPHNRFVEWIGLACNEGTTPSCPIEMSGSEAITAKFEPIPQQTLEVEVAGPGSGTVTSSPAGIACPGTCAAQFDSEGSQSAVILTATPASHDEVAWSGCAAQPSPTECDVTMSEARSVKATFAPIRHTVAVAVAGAGSVSADSGAISGCTASGGACSGSYPEGTVITLRAAAAAGSGFAGWSGACGGVGPCHVTIEADTAVTANFAPIPQGPAPPPAAHLTLGKLTVTGAAAKLAASVSGPGRLTTSGSGLKPAAAAATAAAAGALTLRLALSRAGRRALARSKRGRLAVKVTVSFAASNGALSLVTRVVTFTAERHARHKHRLRQRKH